MVLEVFIQFSIIVGEELGIPIVILLWSTGITVRRFLMKSPTPVFLPFTKIWIFRCLGVEIIALNSCYISNCCLSPKNYSIIILCTISV